MTDPVRDIGQQQGVRAVDLWVPPQAADVEQAVLGAMMLDTSVVPEVSRILETDHFYRPAHRMIYDAMRTVAGRGDPVDLMTVKGELESRGELEKCGGITTLIDISDSVLSAANAPAHAQLIRDKAYLRTLIQTTRRIGEECYTDPGPVGDLLREAALAIRDMLTTYRSTADNSDYLGAGQLTTAFNALGELKKVGTGYRVLDRVLTEGFVPDTFSVIAGRTSEGKTAFRQNVLSNLCTQGHGVLTLATEPTLRTEVTRLLSIRTGIHYDALANYSQWRDEDAGRREIVERALQEIDAVWIRRHVFERSLSFEGAVDWVRRVRDEGVPLGVVFIDRMDVMPEITKAHGAYEKSAVIKEMIQRFLEVGKSEQVHFCALLQLRRAEGGRKARIKEYARPTLDQLRESAGLEEGAELVLFVHRPGKYDSNIPDTTIEVGVGKQREGPAGAGHFIELEWDGNTRRISDPPQSGGA